jgi:5-formyltetrahydrofolate cyclo-ligase
VPGRVAGCDAATVPDDVDTMKAALRLRVQAERREHATTEHRAEPSLAAGLAVRVLGLPEVMAARTVGAYLSIGREPPTTDLVAELRSRGVRVIVPVVRPDRDLDWAEYDESATIMAGLRRSVHPDGPLLGVAAVRAADVLVVPALAVDHQGRRLGRGGGSYDRALARLPAGRLVVALLHDGELLDAVPAAAHDRPVQVVVTPAGVHRLPSPAPPGARRGAPRGRDPRGSA